MSYIELVATPVHKDRMYKFEVSRAASSVNLAKLARDLHSSEREECKLEYRLRVERDRIRILKDAIREVSANL